MLVAATLVKPSTKPGSVPAFSLKSMMKCSPLTGQHFIIDFNEKAGTLPGFVEGFTNVARDEHRHVAFGARFLRDMAREDPATAPPSSARWSRPGRSRRACSAPSGSPRTWATTSCSSAPR